MRPETWTTNLEHAWPEPRAPLTCTLACQHLGATTQFRDLKATGFVPGCGAFWELVRGSGILFVSGIVLSGVSAAQEIADSLIKVCGELQPPGTQSREESAGSTGPLKLGKRKGGPI